MKNQMKIVKHHTKYLHRRAIQICKEIVYDLENSFPYSPYRHINIFRTAGCKRAHMYWECKYCNFYCELLDQYLMERHLCCVCENINVHVRNEMKI